jgi:glutaredoxin
MLFVRPTSSKKPKSDIVIQVSDIVHLIKTEDCLILYSPWCGYSKAALKLLDESQIPYLSVKIEDIDSTMDELINKLSKSGIKRFDGSHRTRPMIFIDGKFIGGYSDLQKILS